MNYLQILKLVVQLLPLIIDAMKAVEAAIPQAGSGSAKLAFVKGMITDVAEIADDVDKKVFGAAIEKAIALAVSLFNTVGIFKKSK